MVGGKEDEEVEEEEENESEDLGAVTRQSFGIERLNGMTPEAAAKEEEEEEETNEEEKETEDEEVVETTEEDVEGNVAVLLGGHLFPVSSNGPP